jgi:hypothetical protein
VYLRVAVLTEDDALVYLSAECPNGPNLRRLKPLLLGVQVVEDKTLLERLTTENATVRFRSRSHEASLLSLPLLRGSLRSPSRHLTTLRHA